MPSGGSATKLTKNYNLTTANNYPPLKNGRINNVLLSQTITLALNTSIPGNGINGFILQGGFLTTITKAGTSCNAGAESCSTGGIMSSLKITSNSKLLILISGKPLSYLLDLKCVALGAVLPQGVSYSDISDAMDVINRSFDGAGTTWVILQQRSLAR